MSAHGPGRTIPASNGNADGSVTPGVVAEDANGALSIETYAAVKNSLTEITAVQEAAASSATTGLWSALTVDSVLKPGGNYLAAGALTLTLPSAITQDWGGINGRSNRQIQVYASNADCSVIGAVTTDTTVSGAITQAVTAGTVKTFDNPAPTRFLAF